MHDLWIERVAIGDIRVSKVWGGDNPADALTKCLDREGKLLTKHMTALGVDYAATPLFRAPTL